MQLLNLSVSKLAALHRDAAQEIARRTNVAVNGHDAANIVFGNEMAKRALVVAAAGNHAILFVGPPNCGKTMLRAVALELGLASTFEARPCPCGYSNDPQITCHCTGDEIAHHRRKFPCADINVHMQRLQQREMVRSRAGLADLRSQIAARGDFRSLDLDEHGANLLKASMAEFGFDIDARQRIIAIARTIANLACRERITPSHLCEAINYRAFGP